MYKWLKITNKKHNVKIIFLNLPMSELDFVFGYHKGRKIGKFLSRELITNIVVVDLLRTHIISFYYSYCFIDHIFKINCLERRNQK